MHTKVKLLGGCRCRLYSNYWGGLVSPSLPPGFGTPVGGKMKQRQTNVEETDWWETIIRVEAQNKAQQYILPSVPSKSMVLYQPKARQQFLLHMRLHFRVTELVECSLFVNRSWHQELRFRSYVWSLSQIWQTYVCMQQSTKTRLHKFPMTKQPTQQQNVFHNPTHM